MVIHRYAWIRAWPWLGRFTVCGWVGAVGRVQTDADSDSGQREERYLVLIRSRPVVFFHYVSFEGIRPP